MYPLTRVQSCRIPNSRSEAGNTQDEPRTKNHTFKQPIYQRRNQKGNLKVFSTEQENTTC